MLSASEAAKRLGSLDWPDSLAIVPEELNAEMVWVPLDRRIGRLMLSPSVEPRLAQLKLPRGVPIARFPARPPAGERAVAAAIAGDIRYAPYWILSGSAVGDKSDDAPWVAVDAFDGQLVAGWLPACRKAAQVRLLFLTLLLLLSIVLGVAVTSVVLARPLSFLRGSIVIGSPSLALYASGAALLVFGYLGWKLRHAIGPALNMVLGRGSGLPPVLEEGALRAEEGRIHFPLDRSWLRLLRSTGVLVLVACVGLLWWMGKTFHAHNALSLLFAVVALTAGVLGGVHATVRANGAWLPTSPEASRPAVTPGGPRAHLVQVVLRMMLLASLCSGLGAIISMTGVGLLLHIPQVEDRSLMMEIGAHIGTVLGVALFRTTPGARLTLILGALLDGVANMWIGGWLATVLVGIAMLGAVLPAAREQPGDQRLSKKVLRLAWAYMFGGVLGRMAGKLVGAVLFGPVGYLLGDVLGDEAGSVIGLMQMRRQGATAHATGAASVSR